MSSKAKTNSKTKPQLISAAIQLAFRDVSDALTGYQKLHEVPRREASSTKAWSNVTRLSAKDGSNSFSPGAFVTDRQFECCC